MMGGNSSFSRNEATEQADRAQLQASDPRASVFVSASAGSGKTKLLIDRLLRLMLPLACQHEGKTHILEGAHPGRILCLTYTKAAAAEMAGRLQSRLGEWVSLPDKALGNELERLNVPNTDETRKKARGLFVKVLDLPGGLRIETIHAFCQSLLRRFPLEAALDPHFSLVEETDGKVMLSQAFEAEIATYPDRVSSLAGQVSFDVMVQTLGNLLAKPDIVAELAKEWALRPEFCRKIYQNLFNLSGKTFESLQEEDRTSPFESELREGFNLAASALTKAGAQKCQPLLEWLRQAPPDRKLFSLESVFLTKDITPRKMNTLVGKEAQKQAPDLISLLEKEGERRLKLYHARKSLELIEINQDFLSLAFPVLSRFQQAKNQRGTVDYNDLISYTRALLRNPGAAWVLYKLDGGIDHLLLDEVQDTSGLQWEIAGAITEDFFTSAGDQAETGRPRTVFAVGDFKQSIYSFQGAEPEQFHDWRHKFAQRVKQAGLDWCDPELNVSFRSVPSVLSFVDHVFRSEVASKGLVEKEHQKPAAHISARPGKGGRVELWPLVPEQGEPIDDESPWQAPVTNQRQQSAAQRLAETLAQWIKQQIGQPPLPGQTPLKAGEILVLVPKRSGFVPAFIRALKTRSVPVASFLRAKVTEQLAVRDLLTLCATLLLPQDDLSLACVLTSPFGGLSDESLMALMTGDGKRTSLEQRDCTLWDMLREKHLQREEWRSAWEWLSVLYRRVDFESPYELLMQALGPLGGRTRILARLGAEASDAIDELLTMALSYEKEHVPSLQGFLKWVEDSDLDTRREAETASDEVRIMTVHGAKGLQARLVILPDTTALPGVEETVLWTKEADHSYPLWVPRVEYAADFVRMLKKKEQERALAENNRLLYVALTRASDWLVICGWKRNKTSSNYIDWHTLCEQAFNRLDHKRVEDCSLGWEGQNYILQELPEGETELEKSVPLSEPVFLPDWMGSAPQWQAVPACQESALARPLTPSRPEGIEFGPAPASRSPLEIVQKKDQAVLKKARREKALQKGQMIHRLLQRLPEVDPSDRLELARSWLSRPAWQLDEAEITNLVHSVFTVMDNPAFAPLFGPQSRAEQSVSGTLSAPSLTEAHGEGRVVLGKIDRFCLGQGYLWLCDYKTGRFPPRSVEATPMPYLRQMAAYRAVMAQIYPHHQIKCFLLWTEGPEMMELPAPLLDGALWR